LRRLIAAAKSEEAEASGAHKTNVSMNEVNQNQAPAAAMQPPGTQLQAHVPSTQELALLSLGARPLFENGQSTERVVSAVGQLADALGFRAAAFPRWGELIIRVDDGDFSRYEILDCAPLGVDMRKVACTIDVIDKVCAGRLRQSTGYSLTMSLSLVMNLR
jgi:hypothetical protein